MYHAIGIASGTRRWESRVEGGCEVCASSVQVSASRRIQRRVTVSTPGLNEMIGGPTKSTNRTVWAKLGSQSAPSAGIRCWKRTDVVRWGRYIKVNTLHST